MQKSWHPPHVAGSHLCIFNAFQRNVKVLRVWNHIKSRSQEFFVLSFKVLLRLQIVLNRTIHFLESNRSRVNDSVSGLWIRSSARCEINEGYFGEIDPLCINGTMKQQKNLHLIIWNPGDAADIRKAGTQAVPSGWEEHTLSPCQSQRR